MTYFLLKDKDDNIQLIHTEKTAMGWMKELLKQYKEWLKEAKTRKRFSTDTEARAALGGTKGFIWYLILIDEDCNTCGHDYFEELDVDTGESRTITSNPSLA